VSQFDKALAVWEGAPSGAAPDGKSHPLTAPALGDYRREGPSAAGEVGRDEANRPKPATDPPVRPAIEETRTHARPVPLDANLAARLVASNSNALSLEQYRRLAAALHDTQAQQGLKTVMVTSALPEEGKTLTVTNLALTLSASYERRVLVIDADLRAPAVHSAFGIANGSGLSEALRDERLPLPVVEISPRLCVMTAGRPGDAALAGLTSDRMKALLAECSARFDWVLLDTPPVGVLPDAQLLSRLTGAVIFVIAAGSTPSAAVDRAIAELGPECVLGTVLNRVPERLIPGAGYYQHYGTNGNR
jgi:capsular exopolysaccharide synthesis family protein